MRNCSKFLKGHWSNLWNQAVKDQVGANERAQQAADQHQVPAGAMADKATLARAIDQARRGNASRAMALLRSPGLADGTQETVHEELQALHPDDSWEVPAPPDQPPQQELFDFIDGPWVCKQVRGSARGVAVDMWGWDIRSPGCLLLETPS